LFSITLAKATENEGHTVRFGICTDVHKDIMHDADARVTKFIREASKKDLDFIIELGDFCQPNDRNREFLKIWNSYPGEKYHVIGNHEMDGGYSKDQVVNFFNSPARYYSFDKKGFHFIVLDGNDKNPSPDRTPGYPRFIGEEQTKWLINDLKSTKNPVILFSHQSLESDGIENRQQIRAILENENKTAGFKKAIVCFCGHGHFDCAASINEINYININSMSNKWVGEGYQTIRYSKEIDAKYPSIKFTIPYKDPLYAFIEINNKAIIIKGKKSSFVGPGPEELAIPGQTETIRITPVISDRRIKR
jgi:calcineurin-like phosphoesterase family protein